MSGTIDLGGDWQVIGNDGGNTTIEYTPTGDTYTLQNDGTLTTPAVETKNLSNAVLAKKYSGSNLKQKIVNALSDLPKGKGPVLVTQKDDGTAWSWGESWTVDPETYNGVSILLADDVHVLLDVSDGNGPHITVDTSSFSGQQFGKSFSLRGGRWQSTISDPDDFLVSNDGFGLVFRPRSVIGLNNTAGSATVCKLRNVDDFHEQFDIAFRAKAADRLVDFVPASVTGGTGSGSFQDGYVRAVGGANDFGYRLRGKPHDTNIQPSLTLVSDGATGYILDGELRGLTLVAPGVENPGDANTNITGWDLKSNLTSIPTVVGGSIGTSVENPVTRASSELRLRVQADDGDNYPWRDYYEGEWERIEKFEDTDTTTAFDYDSGSLPAATDEFKYEMYKLTVTVHGQGGGATDALKLRINGNSQSNYRYTYLGAGTVGEDLSQSEWQDQMQDDETAVFEYLIRGGDHVADPTGDEHPSISSVGPGHEPDQSLQNGIFNGNVNRVSRLRAFTGFNAAGAVTLRGKRL